MSNFSIFDIEFLKLDQWCRARFDYGSEDNPTEHFKNIFHDKESYLEWRQSWREAYKELSKQIRHAKANRSPIRMIDKTYEYSTWAGRAHIGRGIARRMMEYLELGKAHAAKLKTRYLEAEKEAA